MGLRGAPSRNLHPIIDGKLTEASHDPLLMQVCYVNWNIGLQDDMGVFVDHSPTLSSLSLRLL